MLDRLELLVGKEGISKLKNSKIVVIGLGGVGGYVVESLIRSGIENITIVDYDTIDESNLNRQIIAIKENIGKLKVDEFEKRILSINDKTNVVKLPMFIDENNIEEIFSDEITYLIDACDTINAKKLIINKCLEKKINFITCLGTGKRMDPSKLKICDIRKTSYDPIARILRKYIKDMNIKDKIICCYSEEEPIKYDSDVIGSNSFVPASAGLLISSYIVRDICKIKETKL
ncbi:MAG: ThiF family adenylyltransferase [Bacilli bacterium]